MWFDFWGRSLGIPHEEYSMMTIGEISDLIACYQIANGIAEEDKTEYFPDVR